MAADQSGLPPFYGSGDWSKNLGINSRNPFNLPQHPSPFVAHFYPIANPHRNPQSGGQPSTPLSLQPESILNTIAAGRADFLCNELYKNLLNSAGRFDPKLQIKGEHLPIRAPLEGLRTLNGKLDVYSSQLIQRNQIRNFYDSLRQRLTPGDRLLQTPSEDGKIAQGCRADIPRRNPNWQNSTPCEHTSSFPNLPFGSPAQRTIWSRSTDSTKTEVSLMAASSFSTKKFSPSQINRGPVSEYPANISPSKLTSIAGKSSHNLEGLTEMKDSTATPGSGSHRNSPPSPQSDEPLHSVIDRLKRKRRSPTSADTCPVCGITVRGSEVKQHFLHEMSKLEKIPLEVCRNNKRNYACRKPGVAAFKTQSELFVQATTSSKKHEEHDDEKHSSRKLNRQKTFQKVRSNRIDRFNSRVGNCRQASFGVTRTCDKFNEAWPISVSAALGQRLDGVVCPVCNIPLSHLRNYDDIAEHVVSCSGVEGSEPDASMRSERNHMEMVDVDGDCDSFEEYEWCGETRIRATSLAHRELMQGAAGFHMIKAADGESDQELDVESDETRDFGSTQFTDSDLKQANSSDDEVSSNREESTLQERQSTSPSTSAPNTEKVDVVVRHSQSLITEALRMKIKDLEAGQESNRCLICMNSYTDPLVSIQCWHVHCKRCWLRALGVKKLCPQCNMITPASQLRRIYL